MLDLLPAARHGAPKREFSRAKELALTILNAARDDATRIVNRAESLSDSLRREAETSGYAAGVARGIGQLIATAEERAGAVLSARQKIVDLSFEIARAVVGQDIQEHPESILKRVESALAQFRSSAETTLAMNPEDTAVLGDSIPEIRVLPDRSLGRGSFVLRNSAGEIRADLDEHLGRLKDALRRSGTRA